MIVVREKECYAKPQALTQAEWIKNTVMAPGGILSKTTSRYIMVLTLFPYPQAVADIIRCPHMWKLEELFAYLLLS